MPAIAMNGTETLALIREAVPLLRSSAGELPEPPASFASDPGLVENLPPWIARFGLLLAHSATWLYCESRPVDAIDATGQVLLRLPAGRYLVDAFDLRSGRCVSRESASGGPMVAGLPFCNGPVLLAIRKIADQHPDPERGF